MGVLRGEILRRVLVRPGTVVVLEMQWSEKKKGIGYTPQGELEVLKPPLLAPATAQLSSKCLAAALFPTPSRLQVYGECEHPLLPYFLIPKPGASLILKPFISLVIVTRSCGCLSHPFSHTKPDLTHFFFSPAMCFWLRSGLHQLSLNCSTCP